MTDVRSLFNLQGRVAVVTGGSGTLGSLMARGLAAAGARVAINARNEARIQAVVDAITEAGGEAMGIPASVLDKDALLGARDAVLEEWGHVDVLVNGAGGNVKEATLMPDAHFYNLPEEAFRRVFDLNLIGTLLPTQVFGRAMADAGQGAIINVSSMAADRPLTRVVGYAAAKASIDNFTRYLAVELSTKYGEGVRVNAIAPGFFLADQNRALLTNDDGSLTARGQTIIDHTPMGRFGDPEELVGTLLWLASDAARFVTGIVVPVDGGFSAFSGV